MALVRRLINRAANLTPRLATAVDYAVFRGTRRRVSPGAAASEDILARIRRDGFALVENYWSKEDCANVILDFEGMLDRTPQHVQRFTDLRIFGAEELSPNVDRFASDPMLKATSDAICGARTGNAFTLANKVDAATDNRGSGNGWHKDASFRQFKAFLYLNDVDQDNGPLQVIRGSHSVRQYLEDVGRGPLRFRELRLTDQQLEAVVAGDRSRQVTLTGPAGTLLLVNTAVIHRGAPPIRGLRYALTNYYVEGRVLTPEYVEAFAPVSPQKLRRLMRTL